MVDIPHIRNPSPHWDYFKMLYGDVEKSFLYVHPTELHLKVYSLRYYEYLTRACMEFESVCKRELFRGQLAKENDRLGVRDFSRLEYYYDRKPSSYEVGFRFDDLYFVRPLGSWAKNEPLSWYQKYNAVKHNRVAQLSQANLENVLNALAGLFIIMLAAKLCPGEELVFGNKELLRAGRDWPVVVRKDEGDHSYNKTDKWKF